MKPSVLSALGRGRPPYGPRRCLGVCAIAAILLVVSRGVTIAASVPEAWGLLVSGEVDEAATAFRAMITRDATEPEPHRGLAECLRTRGDTDGAVAEFRRAIALGSTHPDARLSLAELYSYRPEDRREAEAMLLRILEDRPTHARARLALARCYGWDDDRTRAKEAYDALLADPALPPSIRVSAQLERGRLASWQGDLARAEADYTEVMARDGSSADAAIGLAEVALWSGNHEAAAERARRIPRDDLGPALAARLEIVEGRLALDAGDERRARDHFAAAERLDPTNADARTWRDRAARARSVRVELRGEFLRDSNGVERIGAVAPIDLALGRTALRTGATWTRYESDDRSVRRWSVPVQVGRSWGSRLTIRTGYALHAFTPEPRAGRTTHSGFLDLEGSPAPRVLVGVRAAIHDAVDADDPFVPRFYNQLVDLGVVDEALRVTEIRGRLMLRPADRWSILIDGAKARLDDDSLFVDDGNDRMDGSVRITYQTTPALTLRAHAYALNYDRRDARLFSPAGFETFGVGLRYERALGPTAWIMTDHGLSFEPDADGIGSEHRVGLGLRIWTGFDLVADAFYLQSPTNPDASEDRYTLRRFAVGIRSSR